MINQLPLLSMQKIDMSDPRPAYVKIAAEIRAAILSGELAPGHPIPKGEDLAEFFEVNRATVVAAIKELRHEGFIKEGAGRVQVQDQAAMPAAGDQDHPLAPVANYAFEVGYLKRMRRTGWVALGVAEPETVAGHSFRAAAIVIALADLEGADACRAATLCVLHDTAETRIMDIDAVSRNYLDPLWSPEEITGHQTYGMPGDTSRIYRELVAEYEAAETLEAKCAKDADKLELLCTAREYQQQGYDTTEWQTTSLEALRTKNGQLIGQAIMSTSPAQWRQAFGKSYHEIKRQAKARRK